MATEKRNIIIVGGGIIGSTAAYFLTRHPLYSRSLHKITIIEAVSLASGASGKAGGLLASWASPACIAKLSYRLHAELAVRHNGAKRWGFRTLKCGSLEAEVSIDNPNSDLVARKLSAQDEPKLSKLHRSSLKNTKPNVPEDLEWIDDDAIKSYREMADPGETAQVHPYLFTTAMADLAAQEGVEIIYGRVTGIDLASKVLRELVYEDKVSGVSHKLAATDLILAAGPWTSQILPTVPLVAQRAHSVVIEAEVSPHALFTEIFHPSSINGRGGSSIATPELYPRPDGTVYVAGEADSDAPLPASSALVACDDKSCQDIINQVSSISNKLKEGKVVKKQACYLPHLSRGGPIIGETKIKGLYLATGHSCWGIQNSCATGKLLSEILFDGKAKSANIDTLNPSCYYL